MNSEAFGSRIMHANNYIQATVDIRQTLVKLVKSTNVHYQLTNNNT